MEEIEGMVVPGVTVGLALGLLGFLLLLLLPGFRKAIAVLSCNRFEPPSAIACQRRCLNAAFRRQWPPALPVGGRPVGGAS